MVVLACLPPDLFISLPYVGGQPGGGEVDPNKFLPLSSVFQYWKIEGEKGQAQSIPFLPIHSLGFS